MRRNFLFYMLTGCCAGLVLVGLGWGLSNFYLVAAGAVMVVASLAWLTMPMPTIF
jgi:hypothetical protein